MRTAEKREDSTPTGFFPPSPMKGTRARCLSDTEDLKLKDITTPSGKVYQMTASDDGQISQIVTPAGYALKYTYKDNLLTSFTNEDGDTIRYEYDKEGHMTSWRDGHNVRQI